MRRLAWCVLSLALTAVASAQTQAFVHVATRDNIDTTATYIDHPALNGQPGARLLVMVNNSAAGGGNIDPHPLGVVYNALRSQWAIVHSNGGLMNPGTAYNVAILDPNVPGTFLHIANSSNISGGATTLSLPLAAARDALVFATEVDQPAVRRPQIGVRYNGTRWSIFREEDTPTTAMPPSQFHVAIVPASTAFVHTSTRTSAIFASTYLDHPMVNNRPDALVFAIHNATPSGAVSSVPVYPQPLGVLYDATHGKWTITTQNGHVVTPGASFNVAVFPAAAPESPATDSGDLRVTGMEITQSIQVYPGNTMPLVGYKQTAVRVYVQGTPGSRGPWTGASGQLLVEYADHSRLPRVHRPVNGSSGVITAPADVSGRERFRRVCCSSSTVRRRCPAIAI